MDIVEIENGICEFYENYVIIRMKEGTNVVTDEILFIKALLIDRFSGNFGWIVDRVNSYSYNPADAKVLLDGLNGLKTAAWVTYGDDNKYMGGLSQSLVPGSIQTRYVKTLEEAVAWTVSALKKMGDS